MWPSYYVRLHSSRFSLKKSISRFLLALFKTFLPWAAISYLKEVSEVVKISLCDTSDQHCLLHSLSCRLWEPVHFEF